MLVSLLFKRLVCKISIGFCCTELKLLRLYRILRQLNNSFQVSALINTIGPELQIVGAVDGTRTSFLIGSNLEDTLGVW